MTPLQGIAETLLCQVPMRERVGKPPVIKRPNKRTREIILDAFAWVEKLPERFTAHDVARVLGVERRKATECITNAKNQRLAERCGTETLLVNGKHLAIYRKTHRQKPEPKDFLSWADSYRYTAEFSAMEVAAKFGVTRWVARTMIKHAVAHQLIACIKSEWRRGGMTYIYRRVRA